MARKKELMELEIPSVEGNNSLDGMDLKELPSSIPQGPTATPNMPDGELPELTEQEIFGDEPDDSVGTNTAHDTGGENDISSEAQPESVISPETSSTSVKARRTTRKKKEEPSAETGVEAQKAESETVETIPLEETAPAETGAEDTPPPSNEGTAEASASSMASLSRRTTAGREKKEAPVLTLEVRTEVETEESRGDAIWHEIHNAYRTRRILTGQLGGIEQTDTGKTITIVDYKGFRIVIPLKEMMINTGRSPSGQEYADLMLRQNKILGNMLGAGIDFIVKGIDSKTRSVVASRKEAMLRKRQTFYLDTDSSGMHRIHEGRIVQARVIAVAEKVIRVEVFGVECSIMARDLAWEWIGDAHERFSVGDQVLVRILDVRRNSLEDIGIRADIKSVFQNTNHDNLKKCRVQSKYAGKVTDVHKGVVYIRLSNGVNAVAHSCYDYRTPGKKDDVSFAVTRIDEERGVAVGIITRIIRQNL